MPSRRNAVLSDVKAFVCVSDSLERYGSSSDGCEASAASIPRTCTPVGSLSRFDDNCGANRPIDAHAWAIGALSGRACWAASSTPSVARAKVRSAIGSTLVNRHCSILVVGKPRRSN
jgi:hypothetical protein